jgi:eukaryotic-like serine/threonine-protein kinase
VPVSRPPDEMLLRYVRNQTSADEKKHVDRWMKIDSQASHIVDRLRYQDSTEYEKPHPETDVTDANYNPQDQAKLENSAKAILAPPQQENEIGRLGDFRVLKILGEGGMGIVFLAEDDKLKRQVALKTMRRELAASASAKDRFLREARASAALEHDHVVPIYHVGEENGTPYLAMPFLKGEPLDQRLVRYGQGVPMPVAETLRIGREVAEGLAAAHDEGLVHRDIKPANIWLETRTKGQPPRVRLLDFGLARALREDSQISHSGMVVGTPAYMAPEQARGRLVDHRADLFSLGVVLYQMSTGERPFNGSDTMAVLSSLALDVPETPCTLNRAVPEALSDLIMRLLEKDAANRPASAEDVVNVLSSIAAGMTLPAAAKAPDPWSGIDDSESDDSEPAAPSHYTLKLAKRKKHRGLLIAVEIAAFGVLIAGAIGIVMLNKKGAKTANSVEKSGKPEVASLSPKKADTPKPGPDRNVDRQAVTRLLPHADLVKVRLESGKEVEIRNAGDIPKEPFAVTWINFLWSAPALPDDFAASIFLPAVLPLQSLETISDESLRLRLSDDDLIKLANAPFRGKLNTLMAGLILDSKTVDALKRFPNLDSLKCIAAQAGDDDVAGLKELTKLTALRLDFLGKPGQITSKGYQALAALPLTLLKIIRAPNLGKDELKILATMPNLTDFSLNRSNVSDELLSEIARFPHLTSLAFKTTLVSDDGIDRLKGMKTLRHLDVEGTKVTEAGARKLSEALPYCRIVRTGGVIVPKPDPDRQAATLLLPHTQMIKVRLDSGNEVDVRKAEDIPDGPFAVTRIQFGPKALPVDFAANVFLPAVLPLQSLEGISDPNSQSFKLSDKDLRKLADAPFHGKLTTLSLGVNLNSNTVDALKQFPKLAELRCLAGQAGDNELVWLKELAHLKRLHIHLLGDSGQVTSKGFNALAALPLTFLSIVSSPSVGVDEVKLLTKMPNLTQFSFVRTNIPDELLSEIARFPKLTFLDLHATPISDNGIDRLKEMQTLTSLNVRETNVSEAGARKLFEALPFCRINMGNQVFIGPKEK